MKRKQVKRQANNTTLESIRTTVDKMVMDKGFEKMTIRDICAEVGITVGTFYHYFKSKDDLMYDRFIRLSDYFYDYYKQILCHENEIDGLKLFVKEYIEYNSTNHGDGSPGQYFGILH